MIIGGLGVLVDERSGRIIGVGCTVQLQSFPPGGGKMTSPLGVVEAGVSGGGVGFCC